MLIQECTQVYNKENITRNINYLQRRLRLAKIQLKHRCKERIMYTGTRYEVNNITLKCLSELICATYCTSTDVQYVAQMSSDRHWCVQAAA